MRPRELVDVWRGRAQSLARYAPTVAAALADAADELEAALRAEASESLTLAQASEVSGYSTETLRKKIAAGQLPNSGRRHAPRVSRGALPTKASATALADSLITRRKHAH